MTWKVPVCTAGGRDLCRQHKESAVVINCQSPHRHEWTERKPSDSEQVTYLIWYCWEKVTDIKRIEDELRSAQTKVNDPELE